ncbi:MAG: PilZ domain-containing protein [Xanthobacteraceae bacterium]
MARCRRWETCGCLGGRHVVPLIAIDPGRHTCVRGRLDCLIGTPRFVTNFVAEGYAMSRENRKHCRRPLSRAAWVRRSDGSTVLCMVRDISEGGARLTGGGLNQVPDHFALLLSRDQKVSRWCRVVRRTDHEIGVQFTASGAHDPLPPSDLPCGNSA